MLKVVIESPFAAPTEDGIQENVTYARMCMKDCLNRGEAPIASHLVYTQPGILRDEVPEDRKLGIEAGFVWGKCAEKVVFYIDRGWSRGMKTALKFWKEQGIETEIRSLINKEENNG